VVEARVFFSTHELAAEFARAVRCCVAAAAAVAAALAAAHVAG
jgi:hypothetical protein